MMIENKVLRGLFVLIAVLVISGFSGVAVTSSSASHDATTNDLTALNAADISAFRWTAMAEFYASNSELLGTANVALTALDAADISAFRWAAMAEFYAVNNELLGTANVDLTTFDAADISAFRWAAMAEYYAVQNELMDTVIHFSPPGR